MIVCPKCARSIHDLRIADPRDICPYCRESILAADEDAWGDVARVANLAEAGFLADELVGHGIDARIHQLPEFNALSDRWSSLYLIRVPATAAQSAAAHIRQYLAEDSSDAETESNYFHFSSGSQPLDPLLWRPLALVILAGVSSFVLGQRFSDRPAPNAERRAPRNSLTSAMESIDRPFIIEPTPGKAGHRLEFDRGRQSWMLDTDRDGDGHYDSTQAFHASGTEW